MKNSALSFIQDKNGKVVLWQTPNLSLTAWFVFMVLGHFLNAGHLKTGFEFLSTAFLFTWAYLELRGGASYFRRSIGLIVLTSIVLAHFKG